MRCEDDGMEPPAIEYPDLQPADERTALFQRLDQYRSVVVASLTGLSWDVASARLLPATDLTNAGIVRHLAWAEDRWLQGRLLGRVMPHRGARRARTIPTTRCGSGRPTPSRGSSACMRRRVSAAGQCSRGVCRSIRQRWSLRSAAAR